MSSGYSPIFGSIATDWVKRCLASTLLPLAAHRPTKLWTEDKARWRDMHGIDDKVPFIPINIAVLTISDTRNEANDRSGATRVERIESAGHMVAAKVIVRDDAAAISAKLRGWIADDSIDAVIATGGTGVTGRDVTPEAFHAVYEKEIAGFGELFRMLSYSTIGSSTIQSRATAGVAGGTYLFA